MKNFNLTCFMLCLIGSVFIISCTTDDVFGELPSVGGEKYEITDEAFGEYLFYLKAAGVTEEIVYEGENPVIKYYIDTELSKNQTGELNLAKSAAQINTLKTAGLRTADIKITNLDGIQFFINVTGITLTSNELTSLDVSKLSNLQTLNLNNNWIGSLDLTHNLELNYLRYTASSKATDSQKLKAIDLSRNTKLTYIDLTGHTGAPFPIPTAIYNQLTTAKGVIADDNPSPGGDNKYEITDEAFGEYLIYLGVSGVTEEKPSEGVFKYYIDTELSKNQTGELNLAKSAAQINTLKTAGLRTADIKITNLDGIQFFINVTGITLTSNELTSLDVSKLSNLQTLNLNNNWIGSLDLTHNLELNYLRYTASSKATDSQKLKAIDLSRNTKLTYIDLTGHTGAPFSIPAAIYNQLTTAKGVKSE